MKKVVFWTVVAVVGFNVIVDPHGLSSVINGLIDLVKNAGTSLGGFLRSL